MGKQEQRPSALDRLVQQAIGAERTLGLPEDKAKERYPVLWDWLSRIYVGRDFLKQPAVLSIRLGPEGVLCTLTDRDLSVSFDVASPTLLEVFDRLEAALSGPNPPIRNWGKREPQLRKRRGGG